MRGIERFINWKFCALVETTFIVWGFVGYWIAMSGVEFMIGVKIAIALAPIAFFMVRHTIKSIKIRRRNRKRQREILLNSKIRRIIHESVA